MINDYFQSVALNKAGGSRTLTSVFGVLISTFESQIWIRNDWVRKAPKILLLNGHQSPKKEKNSPHQPYYSENAFLFFNALNCQARILGQSSTVKKYFLF